MKEKKAKFKYQNEVQKWLDLIRGQLLSTTVDNLKMGADCPPMPFSDVNLLGSLLHTLWFLPNVASCYAMRNLLAQPQNTFYHDYQIIVAAGNEAGMGADALIPVKKAMQDPLKNQKYYAYCGKLTTGVSVAPWAGIFMLRTLQPGKLISKQPACKHHGCYGQDPNNPNAQCILKENCYVFDFALDRALRQLADYSCQLNTESINPEHKVAEFIQFLPVLAYNGSSMLPIDASAILDWQ